MIETLFAKFLGRNYHLALLICISAFLLCLWGHMSGVTYASVVTGVFTAFRTGDAVVNWIHKSDTDCDLDRTHGQDLKGASSECPAKEVNTPNLLPK